MLLTKKIKIYPNKIQREFIEFSSGHCRWLWNTALSQRLTIYRQYRKFISVYDQKKEIVNLKQELPEFKLVYNKNLSEILFRLDNAFKRVRKGRKGFPRFKGKEEFCSLVFPGMYIKYENNIITIPKIGKFKINVKIDNIKEVSICKRKNNYFLAISYEIIIPEKEKINSIIAVDLGIKRYINGVTTSKEFILSNTISVLFKKLDKEIDNIKSRLSKLKKFSRRYKKLQKVLNQLYSYKTNKLQDFNHKLSHALTERQENCIVVGDLQIKAMVGSLKQLNRSVQNNWGINDFVNKLKYKCDLKGKHFYKINEAYTSKTCSKCGKIREMPLYKRRMICECGLDIDRDQNSAINIMNRFVLGRSQPLKGCDQIALDGFDKFKYTFMYI